MIFAPLPMSHLVSEDFQCCPKKLTECVFLFFAGTFKILNDTWSDVRLRLKNHIEGIWKSKSEIISSDGWFLLPDREVSSCFGGPETKWRGALRISKKCCLGQAIKGFTQVAKNHCSATMPRGQEEEVVGCHIRSPPKLQIPSTFRFW